MKVGYFYLSDFTSEINPPCNKKWSIGYYITTPIEIIGKNNLNKRIDKIKKI
jgi:hypothetical protein